MESNTQLPGDRRIPSLNIDRDISEDESYGQLNVYREVSTSTDQNREMSRFDRNSEPSLEHGDVQKDNKLLRTRITLNAIGHALAEFMGVADNDSSDEEGENIDEPDAETTDAGRGDGSVSEANNENGTARIQIVPKTPQRRISNHRTIWENRRIRLAARSYGGIKGTLDIVQQSQAQQMQEFVHDFNDQIDSHSHAAQYIPIRTKLTFIEYSKDAFQWFKQNCCNPNKVLREDHHQDYGPKSFSPQKDPKEANSSIIDEEDEFFQNNVPSQDIVDEGGDQRATVPVGLSRIRRTTLENLQDNSNRRPVPSRNGHHRHYGVGLVGKLLGNKIHREKKNQHSPILHRTVSVRQPLDETEDYRPYFTYWITLAQIFIMIWSLCWYGVANFGVELSRTQGFVKTEKLTLDQIAYYEPANFWVGPRAADLIHLGAKYAPCMREDPQIELENLLRNSLESNTTGCCVRNDGSGCLQTTRDLCSKQLSTFHKWGGYYGSDRGPSGRKSGPVCGQDPRYCLSPVSQSPHTWPDDITLWPTCQEPAVEVGLRNMPSFGAPSHVSCELTGRPCCIGIHGRCELRSAEYCRFVNGYFHPEATLCSQVACMSDVCGMLSFGQGGQATDQFYRLWTSLFLHAGIVHLIITILVQYYLMRDLEKMCGPVRLGIIYLGSGILGNAASAIFVPHRAESGPAGAQFGLLAALLVEGVNVWPILRNPVLALSKLLGILLFLLMLGFLPWIDNFAHIFGFLGGMLLSFAFFPYLTFNNMENNRSLNHCSSFLYTRKGRLWMIGVSVVLFILLLIGLLIIFYADILDCDWCKYFSCIPFTDKFCADQNINLERSEAHLF